MSGPQPVELGRRIVVWGVTASGKTTLAKRLASLLGVSRIELDAIFWKPDWVETPDDEFRAAVQAALDAAGAAWVLDGSYRRISDIYLSRADTLIWLHLPWRVGFWRLLQRTVRRAWTRESLYYEGGPRESWRLSFFDRRSILWWSIAQHRRTTLSCRERIAALPPHVRVRVLRSAGEVEAWLSQLESIEGRA